MSYLTDFIKSAREQGKLKSNEELSSSKNIGLQSDGNLDFNGVFTSFLYPDKKKEIEKAYRFNRQMAKREEEDLIRSGLNQGMSWEDISSQTGIDQERVKSFSEKTRPNYGKKPPTDIVKEVGDFGNAVVDRVGGGTVRGLARLGGLVTEPLPGEQRKAVEDFLQKYSENKGSAKRVGNYDETSTGGQLGRKVGTGIKAGVDIYTISKAGNVTRAGAAGTGVLGGSSTLAKAGRFTAGSLAETGASSAITTGQGNDINLAKETAVGLGVDLLTRGFGKYVKPGEIFSKLPKPTIDRTSKLTKAVADLDKKIATTTDPSSLAQLSAQRRDTVKKLVEKNELSIYERMANKVVDRSFATRRRIKGALGDGVTARNYLDKLDISLGNVQRSSIMAENYLKNNGFESVMQQLGTQARENEFAEYLLAKQRQFRRLEAKETGKKLSSEFLKGSKKDARTVAAFAGEYEPLAQELHQFSQKFLRELANPNEELRAIGLRPVISQDLAEDLIRRNPEYVPLNKVLADIENNGITTSSPGSLSKQGVVYEFKGAGGIEENPLLSIYEKAHVGFNNMSRNGTGQLIKSLKDIDGNPLGIKILKDSDLPAKGKATISVLTDGVKETIEVPDYIEKALKGLNQQQNNALIRGLYLLNRIRKVGFTGGSPGFASRNIPRDLQQKTIVGRQGFKNLDPRKLVAGWADALMQTSTRKEAEALGAYGNLVDTFRGTKRTFNTMRSSGSAKSVIANKIKHPADLFRALEDAVSLTETSSRSTSYRVAYEAAFKETGDKAEAIRQGVLAARRDSTDFFVQSEYGDIIKAWGLYLNPAIQGTRRFGQALIEQPAKTTARLAAFSLGPSVATTYWNMNDPKRREAYDSIPQWEKDANHIIVGPNAKFNEEKNRWEGIYKIPKPPGISGIANAAEDLVRQGMSEGIDMKDFVRELGFGVVDTVNPEETLAGAIIPDPIEPFVSQAANKNFFTGKEIVPENDKYREAKEEYTSGFAKLVSDKLSAIGVNVSPLRVDALTRDFTGSTGQGIQNFVERALGVDNPGGKSFAEQIKQSFIGSYGGAKKQEVSTRLDGALNDKPTISSDVTDLVQNGDVKQASKIAEEYNKKIDELMKFAQDSEEAKLSDSQKKLLESLKFPVRNGRLSESSIKYRLKQ